LIGEISFDTEHTEGQGGDEVAAECRVALRLGNTDKPSFPWSPESGSLIFLDSRLRGNDKFDLFSVSPERFCSNEYEMPVAIS
jgi:hypothetical protein